MFWAEKGLGAYSNNQRLRVSARIDMSECLLATGLPFKGSRKNPIDVMKEVNAATTRVAGIRRMGSAALDLAFVAAGRFDGYWESQLGVWDIAAGYILVKEAGGFISPLVAGKDPVMDTSIIATNAGIHDQLVKILRESKK